VKRGDVITRAQSDAFLRADLARLEAAVNRLAPQTWQAQFGALVSLKFTVGEGNLAGSTLLKLQNAGDQADADAQVPRWNRAAGKVLAGRTRRRSVEATIYRSEQCKPCPGNIDTRSPSWRSVAPQMAPPFSLILACLPWVCNGLGGAWPVR
tara:strand:+ start:72 stop:527 length:456 start_codon:yes stop_codon:yes gene_type:complete